jgi:DNA modification methylase
MDRAAWELGSVTTLIDTSASGHYTGDCRALLRRLPDGCIQTCITSPPYWNLRDYGTGTWEGGDPACDHRDRSATGLLKSGKSSTLNGTMVTQEAACIQRGHTCSRCGARRVDRQIGLEPTPGEYVETMVAVFREVRRVLRDDGTLWPNLGDGYASAAGGYDDDGSVGATAMPRIGRKTRAAIVAHRGRKPPSGLKPKDLIGMPWEVALALRRDGWYLRSDVIWAKPNPMPESVTDRPTKSHEYLFLLSKSERYFYDADAIREPLAPSTLADHASKRARKSKGSDGTALIAADNWGARCGVRKPKLDEAGAVLGANKRSVWTVATQPYYGAHFATFPPALIEPCVLAGSRVGDVVLDPFFGSGTTGMVAEKHGRKWIGFDLNPKYAELAKGRTAQRSLMSMLATPHPTWRCPVHGLVSNSGGACVEPVADYVCGLTLAADHHEAGVETDQDLVWPYGPADHHEAACRLHAAGGEGHCDCKASDASDTEYGIGGWPTPTAVGR